MEMMVMLQSKEVLSMMLIMMVIMMRVRLQVIPYQIGQEIGKEILVLVGKLQELQQQLKIIYLQEKILYATLTMIGQHRQVQMLQILNGQQELKIQVGILSAHSKGVQVVLDYQLIRLLTIKFLKQQPQMYPYQ